MLKQYLVKTLSEFWNIGFVEDDLGTIINSQRLNVKWMVHDYKDRWFADPYILYYDCNEIIVLVEEFSYSSRKGRIARLVIGRKDYRLRDMKIVLEEPTHLSFPFIFRKENNIFVIPENFHSNSLKYYKFNPNGDKLAYCGTIIDKPLTDATLVTMLDGKHYILSTSYPSPNGSQLSVFSLNANTMKADENPIQIISFESNIARNAGAIFTINGVMYRPAQDCNGGYGKGIYLQKIAYNEGVFSFENMNSFYTDEKKYGMGFHTFNTYQGLTVVDAHGMNSHIRRKMLSALLKLKDVI